MIAYYQKYKRFENRNFYINVALVVLGLACAASTTARQVGRALPAEQSTQPDAQSVAQNP